MDLLSDFPFFFRTFIRHQIAIISERKSHEPQGRLKAALAEAEALGEQRRQQSETATKRADALVAELVATTGELIELSNRMGEQTATTDKLRAGLDELRSRSWWWQHASGGRAGEASRPPEDGARGRARRPRQLLRIAAAAGRGRPRPAVMAGRPRSARLRSLVCTGRRRSA
jgi:hypothetical protein